MWKEKDVIYKKKIDEEVTKNLRLTKFLTQVELRMLGKFLKSPVN